MRDSLAVSNITKHPLTIQSAIVLLDIYLREVKPFVYLHVFKFVKTHKSQDVGEWINTVYPFDDMFLSLKIND